MTKRHVEILHFARQNMPTSARVDSVDSSVQPRTRLGIRYRCEQYAKIPVACREGLNEIECTLRGPLPDTLNSDRQQALQRIASRGRKLLQ